MTSTSDLFLGVIALSVLAMAIIQVGAIFFLARYAKRLMTITEDLQREIRPLAAGVNAIVEEAHRATRLAAKQVERVDALVADVTRRVHDTTAAIESVVTGPMRHGSAILNGLRAVIVSMLTTKPRRRVERDEEEDALFVG